MTYQKVRSKVNFDRDWFFHKGDIPIPYAVKAGKTGGITDIGSQEQGEWLEIAFVDQTTEDALVPKDWQRISIPHD
ncbi:hypothetical protein GC096_07345 [Paenibacillus sp. LMG 31461]|uniref:DUF4926 domain-containing protein n=1 Tax=Paenibacillus plantarum TaxID=2654975 RepID=A0ABX1X607_9BACL|nr:hypothetical protein [Paenibacillus plantarum]NOU63837.1 hypothetical protein [Paenibacillus plantarum]